MRAELHPEARIELRSATLWYEERRPGLGEDLIEQVTVILKRIAEAPVSYPRWPGTETAPIPIRKAVLARFPYDLAFEVHEERVLVLAIAHLRRRPLYWLARTSGESA